MPEDVRAWLESIVRPDGAYTSPARIQARRRWMLAIAAVAGILAVGILGYSIGSSRAGDAESAQRAGMSAGGKRGAIAGEREGYRKAFRPAREQAYRKAYRAAYLNSYNGAFEKAGVAKPDTVKVPMP